MIIPAQISDKWLVFNQFYLPYDQQFYAQTAWYLQYVCDLAVVKDQYIHNQFIFAPIQYINCCLIANADYLCHAIEPKKIRFQWWLTV